MVACWQAETMPGPATRVDDVGDSPPCLKVSTQLVDLRHSDRTAADSSRRHCSSTNSNVLSPSLVTVASRGEVAFSVYLTGISGLNSMSGFFWNSLISSSLSFISTL